MKKNEILGFEWALNRGDMDALRAVLYVHLAHSITRYRELLQREKRRGGLDHVAWITRNVVELWVWAKYCAQSAEHADEFSRDAVRDLHDLQEKVGGLDADTLQALEKAKAFIGTARKPHKYTTVDEAAEQLGLKPEYAANCKILSKFVHPTAVSVLAPVRGGGADAIRRQFVSLGWKLADEALQTLNSSRVGDSYRKYRTTMNQVLPELPEGIRPFPKERTL